MFELLFLVLVFQADGVWMFGSSYENSDTDAKLEKKETGPTPKEKNVRVVIKNPIDVKDLFLWFQSLILVGFFHGF